MLGNLPSAEPWHRGGMGEPLFHLAEAEHWAAALATGRYERSTLGASLAEVGFVHLCTGAQWPGVLGRFYRGHEGDVVLLSLDPDRLEAELRWEAPHPASDERFPHLYGALPTGAVTATRVLSPPFDGPAG